MAGYRTRLSSDQLALYEQVNASGLLFALPKNKIEHWQKQLTLSRKERFLRRREEKYGDLPRHTTEEELTRILLELKNPKAHLLFKVMSATGLRISEGVVLRAEDVSWNESRIYTHTLKRGVPGWVVLTLEIRELLHAWVRAHHEEIVRSGGYLFFCRHPGSARLRQHVHANHMRTLFREARIRAGVGRVYGKTFERSPDRAPKRLCNITTHSMRHRFGQLVRTQTRDVVLTAKALRLSNIQHVARYSRPTPEEITKAVSDAMTIRILPKKKRSKEGEVSEELLLD